MTAPPMPYLKKYFPQKAANSGQYLKNKCLVCLENKKITKLCKEARLVKKVKKATDI